MLNKVFIMGRLTRDPELRRTQSGIPVVTMGIAVDRDYKNQDGTKSTDFFDVVAWRATAEFVSKWFTKGRMAVIEGRLQRREWTDRDNNRRFTVEIIADNIYFGDSKRDSGNGNYSQSFYNNNNYNNSAAAPNYGDASPDADFMEISEDDGDLPF